MTNMAHHQHWDTVTSGTLQVNSKRPATAIGLR